MIFFSLKEQYFLPSKNHIGKIYRKCHTSNILTPNGKENAQKLAVSITSKQTLPKKHSNCKFSSEVYLSHRMLPMLVLSSNCCRITSVPLSKALNRSPSQEDCPIN